MWACRGMVRKRDLRLRDAVVLSTLCAASDRSGSATGLSLIPICRRRRRRSCQHRSPAPAAGTAAACSSAWPNSGPRSSRSATGQALPGRGAVSGAPYWSEAPFLIDRVGCPTAYCAPGDISTFHTSQERASADAYVPGIVGCACLIPAYSGTVIA